MRAPLLFWVERTRQHMIPLLDRRVFEDYPVPLGAVVVFPDVPFMYEYTRLLTDGAEMGLIPGWTPFGDGSLTTSREQRMQIMLRRPMALAAAFVLMIMSVSNQYARAATFTVLHNFDLTDGQYPEASLIQATNGKLYGTTAFGGDNGNGTVYEITLPGTLTTLFRFDYTDGAYPSAGLVQATNGELYGTTTVGSGAVFEITQKAQLSTLATLNSTADGIAPNGVIQAASGDFYGTTSQGGPGGAGAVFRVTPSGVVSNLYSFGDAEDGGFPSASLVEDINGDFYGTTIDAGASGDGTIFRITPSGALTTVYNFCSEPNCTDGAYTEAALIQTANGDLYGTTQAGGVYDYGTVFRITPTGKLTTLYSFCAQANCADGAVPVGALVQASDGNVYGITGQGGVNNGCNSGNLGCGTIFRITPTGVLTTLYSFCAEAGCADGDSPNAGLVQATNGDFYGATMEGGANTYGTVFRLSVGLGPFVQTQTKFGRAGAAVTILGTNLKGATSVAFNGTVSTFTVVSTSEITTTVPIGATTGYVEVKVPGGTLKSNVMYTVEP